MIAISGKTRCFFWGATVFDTRAHTYTLTHTQTHGHAHTHSMYLRDLKPKNGISSISRSSAKTRRKYCNKEKMGLRISLQAAIMVKLTIEKSEIQDIQATIQ